MAEKTKVNPWRWQNALGFSQAIEIKGAQGVLYCAGQTSMDADGNPLHESDMSAQAREAMDNLETVLREAGYSLSDIVRINYYTTDVDAFFAAYPEAVAGRLAAAGCQPASTLLGVTRLAFPQLMIEIEATAAK